MRVRDKEKKSAGILLATADAVVLVLSFLVAAALMLSYLAPHVDPRRAAWFAFLGLAAPFLYVADVVLALYWTMRWRPVALLLLFAALLGLGHVSKFFRPELSRRYEQPRETGTLRVLSYNVEGFFGKDSLGKRENQMQRIVRFIAETDPDIFCLQEFEYNRVNTLDSLESALGEWKYRALFLDSTADRRHGRGLALFSKYRVIPRGGIRYPGSTNSSMWADVIVHRDTVRVYNNHMQSTQISEDDKQFLGAMAAVPDSARDDRAKGIVRKLVRNFRVRATQADSVAGFIHDGTPRVIVCGDFNDTPMSYTYRRLRGDLTDAFARKGRGMIYTYRGFLGVFRIDYLFHSDDFETVDYDSEQPMWSDHNPVIVDLKLRR